MTMTEPSECSNGVDVAIVGCGPVGAALANLLGRFGVSTLVVDAATDIFRDPRAIALDNEALRALQMIGLGEEDFARIVIPHVRMRSPIFGEFARMDMRGEIDGHPKLVTFYQPELEEALRWKLRAQSSVSLMLGWRAVALAQGRDHVLLTLEKGGVRSRVGARYVVGADGARSFVRAAIDRGFEGRSFVQDWLIVDARNVARPIDHVEFLCDPRRPTPHMVAPGGRERWEFMLRRGETKSAMETDATIARLLAAWKPGPGMTIERKAVYRFHARVADGFSVGRVHLVGDAAHITPPFAGQGLVAGLRDAVNLAWKLAWVVKGRADPHILASYDEERRPHARAMIRVALFMGRLVMPRNVLAATAIHGAIRLARLSKRGRHIFDELGIKPANRFRRGLFLRARSRRPGLVTGQCIPQARLCSASGRHRLSDDVLGDHFAVVGFGGDPLQWTDAALARRFRTCGGTFVTIVTGGSRPAPGENVAWEDVDGGFRPVLNGVDAWFAIVRPDKVLMIDGPPDQLSDALRKALGLIAPPPAHDEGQARRQPPSATFVSKGTRHVA